MLKFCCTLLSLIVCITLSAQTSPPAWQGQVGTDITPLVTRVLNFGGTASATELSFAYRKHNAEKGTNFRLRAETFVAINVGGNNIDRIDVGLTFGTEKIRPFGQRWEGYLGWEARIGVETERFGDLDRSLGNIVFGPAVVAGLNFRLNDRLLLSTEAALPLLFSLSTGDLDDGFGANLAWRVPTSLFLHYRW